MRLSYSSSTLYQGCKRKFYYKKTKKQIDRDSEQDTTALRVGKAFHQIQEDCLHEKKKFKGSIATKAFVDNQIEEETQRQMIMAMCLKYWELHSKQGLTIICCEMEIGDENVIGYIDAVMRDENGYWYIVDLKTAGRLNSSLLSRLSRDVQLNLYSYYASQVAAVYDLDLAMFAGTRYRVTTKCTIKKQARETSHAFRDRCYSKIESYDIFIPEKDLIAEETHASILKLRDEAMILLEKREHEIPQNMSYCENYFKPCEWWSQCYGNTFTDGAKNLSLTDSINAAPVLGTAEPKDDLL